MGPFQWPVMVGGRNEERELILVSVVVLAATLLHFPFKLKNKTKKTCFPIMVSKIYISSLAYSYF